MVRRPSGTAAAAVAPLALLALLASSCASRTSVHKPDRTSANRSIPPVTRAASPEGAESLTIEALPGSGASAGSVVIKGVRIVSGEEKAMAELPLKVRLLADGAVVPGGKASRRVVTGSDGRASLPLAPLLAELPDTAGRVEVVVSPEAEGGKEARAQLGFAYVQSILAPARHERLGDEAAAEGKGLVALDHYANAVALRKEDARTLESFRKLASTYRTLPLKPAVPEDVRRLLVQAEALAKENDPAQATAKLDEAVKKAPWLPTAWYNRAFARAMEKDYGGAIASMETYLLLSPDAPDARKAKDQVYQWEALAPAASAPAGGGDPDSAKKEAIRQRRLRGR